MSDTVPDVRQIASHPGQTQDGRSDEHSDSQHSDSQHSDSQHSEAHHGVDVDNIITAILASYRGYDTLGETIVIFTAGIGVLLLLRGARRGQSEVNAG